MEKVAMVPADISNYAVIRDSIYEPFEGLGTLQDIRHAAGLPYRFKFYENKSLSVLVGGNPLIRICVGRGRMVRYHCIHSVTSLQIYR